LLVNTAIEWLTRHAAAVESAAAAQRVSEARYRNFREFQAWIYRTTPEGRIVTVNPALLRHARLRHV